MKSIRNRDYEGLINFLYQDYLHKCALFNFFIYRPLRSIVNFKVIDIGTKNIMNYIHQMKISIIIRVEITTLVLIVKLYMV